MAQEDLMIDFAPSVRIKSEGLMHALPPFLE